MAHKGDTEVTFEDQQRINAFGRGTSQLHEYDAVFHKKTSELARVQDAQAELLSMDDGMPCFCI